MRTAAAIAERSGPSVVFAFMVAGFGCVFAGLCYAEFASMIPISEAPTPYSYATMGEFVAWIIGWDLVLPTCDRRRDGRDRVDASAFNRVLQYFRVRGFRSSGVHSPFEAMKWRHGIMNVPAVLILAAPLRPAHPRNPVNPAMVNNLIVITKLTFVVMVIVLGWPFINPVNHTPFVPAATTYTTPEA